MTWTVGLVIATVMTSMAHSQVMVDLEKEGTRPSNGEYSYSVDNYKGRAWVSRNENGTFFEGKFSTLYISTKQRTHRYTSTRLSFKTSPQHKIAPIQASTLEMHMHYQLDQGQKLPWKHRQAVMVVTFVETELEMGSGAISGQLLGKDQAKEWEIDTEVLLPLVARLPMVLYKGRHSLSPQDASCLWLVRKQLLLIGRQEHRSLLTLLGQHLKGREAGYDGVLQKISWLYQMPQTQIIQPLSDDI